MKKNMKFVFVIFAFMLLFTGCVAKSEYTAQEEEVLADYMAQLVFRHSKGYDYKLVDVSKNPFIREEIIYEGTEEQMQLTDKDENDIVKTGSENMEKDNESEDIKDEISIASAMGFDKNIEIKVMKCSVVDELTKGAYFIEPEKGDKLVKVDLKFTNVSKEKVNVKYNKDTKCMLQINSTDIKPLMTALDNDIAFVDKDIKAGKSINVSVVYSVDANVAEQEKALNIASGDNSKTVELD